MATNRGTPGIYAWIPAVSAVLGALGGAYVGQFLTESAWREGAGVAARVAGTLMGFALASVSIIVALDRPDEKDGPIQRVKRDGNWGYFVDIFVRVAKWPTVAVVCAIVVVVIPFDQSWSSAHVFAQAVNAVWIGSFVGALSSATVAVLHLATVLKNEDTARIKPKPVPKFADERTAAPAATEDDDTSRLSRAPA